MENNQLIKNLLIYSDNLKALDDLIKNAKSIKSNETIFKKFKGTCFLNQVLKK